MVKIKSYVTMDDDRNIRGNNSGFVHVLQMMTTDLLENSRRSTKGLFRWSPMDSTSIIMDLHF